MDTVDLKPVTFQCGPQDIKYQPTTDGMPAWSLFSPAWEADLTPRPDPTLLTRDREDVAVSRVVESSSATQLLVVQWDTVADIWTTVASESSSYEYAEPPTTGSTCAALDTPSRAVVTRWPQSVYEVWKYAAVIGINAFC